MTPTSDNKMKFLGELDSKAENRVANSDVALTDPNRLAAIARTGLMDSPREEAFDRLASLAAKILKVPLTIVSIVGKNKQFFKAGHGLPAPYDELREVPIDTSICRYTLRGEEIIAADASADPLLQFHPTTGAWGIAAFIAIPMVTTEGQVLGAFCAVDSKERPWSEEDIYVMRELTKSVMTEIDLRLQVTELEAERELRERFVTSLSHDLRTPLSIVQMSANLLDGNESNFDERQRLTKMISENAIRADQMILDLLDATRIKTGRAIPLSVEPCDLRKVISSTIETLKSMHGARFVLEAPDALVGYLDHKSLRRAIENLINNAAKYGSEKTPITITVKAIDREFIEISIHNVGNPIAEENIGTLFDAFQRGSDVNSSQRGWGIGLSLVRGFAEAHGGSATVTSNAESGTTFVIRIVRDAHLLDNNLQ